MKIFCSSALLAVFTLAPVFAESEKIFQLVIETVMFDSVITHIPFEKDVMQSFEEREIFDVYERKEEIAGKTIYAGFVDSVYLTSSEFLQVADKFKLTFVLVWEGEDKNLASGQYLVPTGRIFAVDGRADAHGAAADVIAGSGQIDLADGFDVFIIGGSVSRRMSADDEYTPRYQFASELAFRFIRSIVLRAGVWFGFDPFAYYFSYHGEYQINWITFADYAFYIIFGAGSSLDASGIYADVSIDSKFGLFLEFPETRGFIELSMITYSASFDIASTSWTLNLMFGYRIF